MPSMKHKTLYTRQQQKMQNLHRVANHLEQLYIEQTVSIVDSNIKRLAAKNVRHGHEPKIYFFMKPFILNLQHSE